MSKPYAKKPYRLPCYSCGKTPEQNLDLCNDCSVEHLTKCRDNALSGLMDALIGSPKSGALIIAQMRAFLLEAEKDLAFAKGKLLDAIKEEAKK